MWKTDEQTRFEIGRCKGLWTSNQAWWKKLFWISLPNKEKGECCLLIYLFSFIYIYVAPLYDMRNVW